MNNKNYIITKDDIYIAEVVAFDDINGNYLAAIENDKVICLKSKILF